MPFKSEKNRKAFFANLRKGKGERIFGGTVRPLGSRGFRLNPRNNTIYNMDNAKDINRQKGKHFFDKEAMRFFNSRISDMGIRRGDDVYFSSSEKFDSNSPRLYSVRKINLKSGNVDSIGEFQQYKTKKQADKAINNLIK